MSVTRVRAEFKTNAMRLFLVPRGVLDRRLRLAQRPPASPPRPSAPPDRRNLGPRLGHLLHQTLPSPLPLHRALQRRLQGVGPRGLAVFASLAPRHASSGAAGRLSSSALRARASAGSPRSSSSSRSASPPPLERLRLRSDRRPPRDDRRGGVSLRLRERPRPRGDLGAAPATGAARAAPGRDRGVRGNRRDPSRVGRRGARPCRGRRFVAGDPSAAAGLHRTARPSISTPCVRSAAIAIDSFSAKCTKAMPLLRPVSRS